MAGHTVCLYSSLGSKVLTICRAVHDACPHPYRDSIASLTSVISLVQNHCSPAQYTLPSTGSREPKTIETGSSDHKPFPCVHLPPQFHPAILSWHLCPYDMDLTT